jgi:hypothetical protein
MQVETSLENSGGVSWIARRGFAETLACAIGFLAYVPTLGFQFVYDDKPQIIQNPAIRAWRYLPNYFTSHVWAELYPHVGSDYYRPVFLLWFRLNHAMFGVNPVGWHLTTVLCHVAATYLVFRLVRRLAASPWTAFSAATLFALHPVYIESVAWVSGVTDPLLAILLLGSFLAYMRFREGNRWGWMGLALAFFVLGLLEKETAVVLGPPDFLVCVALRGGAFLDFPLRDGFEAFVGISGADGIVSCSARARFARLVAPLVPRDMAHHGANRPFNCLAVPSPFAVSGGGQRPLRPALC